MRKNIQEKNCSHRKCMWKWYDDEDVSLEFVLKIAYINVERTAVVTVSILSSLTFGRPVEKFILTQCVSRSL